MAPLAAKAETGKAVGQYELCRRPVYYSVLQLLSVDSMVERNAVERIAFLHNVDAGLLGAATAPGRRVMVASCTGA